MNKTRKTAEELGFRFLREHPESLQALLDTIICGILTVDRNGRVNFTNNSARRLLDRSREDLIGILFDEVGWTFLNADGVPVPHEELPFTRVLRTGETIIGEIYAVDHANGTRAYFSMNAVPLRDRSGHIAGAAADLIDISERTLLQQERERLIRALSESESRFRMLAESAPVAVFECDGEGCWLYLNPQWVAISGRTEEESLGGGWTNALHPEDRAAVLEAWRRSAAEPGIWKCEFRLLHPSGRIVWVCTAKKAIAFEGLNSTRFVGVIEDTTTRKEAERALREAKDAAEEASAAKSRFLSIMSHELRTPMTIFMGMVQLTLSSDLDQQQRHYLESAMSAAESLLALIEDLLLFSDLESGDLILERHPFELGDCVREATKGPAAEAARKGLRFEVAYGSEVPPSLVGDARLLRQVLFNLANNAVKFTRAGEVVLEVKLCRDCLTDRESVIFSVRDTGQGIPQERLGQLFQPFSPLDATSTRRHGGTGMGLAISRELVERMGGAIRAESRPGEGSVFSFFVPLQ